MHAALGDEQQCEEGGEGVPGQRPSVTLRTTEPRRAQNDADAHQSIHYSRSRVSDVTHSPQLRLAMSLPAYIWLENLEANGHDVHTTSELLLTPAVCLRYIRQHRC